MDNVIPIGGKETALDAWPDLLLNEQLAAQSLAVIQSHFTRPSTDRIRSILKCMESQLLAQETTGGKL